VASADLLTRFGGVCAQADLKADTIGKCDAYVRAHVTGTLPM
jgi:hypothetical protein